MEKLFSYGTLRYEAVQIETFGRKLQGSADVLTGYKLSQLTINDPHVVATSGDAVHPILVPSNDINDHVEGMVFEITSDELASADKYEVDEYQRVQVTLASGCSAWVYVAK